MCFQGKKVHLPKCEYKFNNLDWDREAHCAHHAIEGGNLANSSKTGVFHTISYEKARFEKVQIWIIIMYLETPFTPLGQCCLFMWPGRDRVYQHWLYGGRGEPLSCRARPTTADLAKIALKDTCHGLWRHVKQELSVKNHLEGISDFFVWREALATLHQGDSEL